MDLYGVQVAVWGIFTEIDYYAARQFHMFYQNLPQLLAPQAREVNCGMVQNWVGMFSVCQYYPAGTGIPKPLTNLTDLVRVKNQYIDKLIANDHRELVDINWSESPVDGLDDEEWIQYWEKSEEEREKEKKENEEWEKEKEKEREKEKKENEERENEKEKEKKENEKEKEREKEEKENEKEKESEEWENEKENEKNEKEEWDWEKEKEKERGQESDTIDFDDASLPDLDDEDDHESNFYNKDQTDRRRKNRNRKRARNSRRNNRKGKNRGNRNRGSRRNNRLRAFDHDDLYSNNEPTDTSTDSEWLLDELLLSDPDNFDRLMMERTEGVSNEDGDLYLFD